MRFVSTDSRPDAAASRRRVDRAAFVAFVIFVSS